MKPAAKVDFRQKQAHANAEAGKAAAWMIAEMNRNSGVLLLADAWTGVHERFGEACAQKSETDRWLSKAVLAAFRKLTPDSIWDPATGGWRLPHRRDNHTQGERMLKGKPSA